MVVGRHGSADDAESQEEFMARRSTFLLAVALCFAAPLASPVAARVAADCADYISTGRGNHPATGVLAGTYEVTEWHGYGQDRFHRGTRTFGIYWLSDGTRVTLDCATYARA
jgi:hypothetical protein